MSTHLFAILLATFSTGFARASPPFLSSNLFDGQITGEQTPSTYSVDPQRYLADQKAYRLPGNVIPEAYQLYVEPGLSGDFKFNGEVKIHVLVAEKTSSILLHSHKLDIRSLKVYSENSAQLKSSYVLLPATHILNITLNTELSAHKQYVIAITFEGQLNDNMVGFYRSRYESKGEIKWIATTQFEPTYARMAFPCFDEPRFRAKFSISIVRYEHQRVISNMPLKDTSFPIESLDNRVIDDFHTTPPMPTYLVAFTVSEFYFIANDIESFRVWAREEVHFDGEYALAEVEGLNEHMENYTKIYYHLPKLDLAAIPDFDAGAMENWGLTTYREPYVLCSNVSNSKRNQEDVSSVVAHELAHQWFGNYVTLDWWDYLWLNEGFATYFQYFLINEMNSHWRMEERMVVEATHTALAIDGISVHRPLNALVNTPSEISSLFDGISYQKGAAVLNMIQIIMYDFQFMIDNFQLALRSYLQERYNDGGVARPDDLYNQLENMRLITRIPNMPPFTNLYQMMEQFTNQVGYPLLTVTRHTGIMGVDIRMKQTPYRSPRSSQQIPDQLWTIPITCARRRQFHMYDVRVEHWSYTKDEILLENEVEEKEWIICNVQQKGYYRVNYDRENWNLIRDQLLTAPEEIHPVNRAQIMDDSFTFALDEKLSFSVAINLLSYLKYEPDAIPWYTGIRKLQNLYTKYEATSVGVNLKRFAKDMITNYYNSVGFDPNPENEQPTAAFRSTLLMVSCSLDISDCRSKAMHWYNRNSDLSRISGDIRETVLCTAMRKNSTMATWNRLWKFYKETIRAVEKETVLLAIGCATDEEIHKKYLFKLVDDHDVDIRSQNYGHVFRSMLRHCQGVTSTLKFIKEMLPNLSKHKKARGVVLSLLKRMKSVVKSKKHVNLLDDAITESEKLDQQRYGDVTTALKDTKKAALVNIRDNERRVRELSVAMKSYEKTPNNKKTSSAFSSSPPTTLALLLCASLMRIYCAVNGVSY